MPQPGYGGLCRVCWRCVGTCVSVCGYEAAVTRCLFPSTEEEEESASCDTVSVVCLVGGVLPACSVCYGTAVRLLCLSLVTVVCGVPCSCVCNQSRSFSSVTTRWFVC